MATPLSVNPQLALLEARGLAAGRSAGAGHGVFDARVVATQRVLQARQGLFEVTLQIGERQLKVTSEASPVPGTRVRLRMIGPDQLQLLAAPGRAAPAAGPGPLQRVDAMIDRGLRAALPRQQALGDVLAALRAAPLERTRALPAPALDALRELLKQVPAEKVLGEHHKLRELLRNSGVFFESRLRAHAADPARIVATDLKARLLRVLAGLGQRPPAAPALAAAWRRQAGPGSAERVGSESSRLAEALLELVRGALARLQVQQLAALSTRAAAPGDGQPASSLELEIPFLRQGEPHTLPVTIERFSGRGNQRETAAGRWQVTLAFDLPGLGQLTVQASLSQARLSTTFWGTRAALAAVRRHLPELAGQLERHGIDLEQVAYAEGEPPRRRSGLARPLLDLST